jgi:glucosamine--fructose-6-phosphate aminotransferase (isomerizing)
VCGIAGFVSNTEWKISSDLKWVDELLNNFESCCINPRSFDEVARPIEVLMWRFEDLMSFDLHFELIQSEIFRNKVERISQALERIIEGLPKLGSGGDCLDLMDKISQDARDCLWQIRYEVLGNLDRSMNMLNSSFLDQNSMRAQRFAAWSIERVLENIDRLEVRGRDSAGISIQFLICDKNVDSNIFHGKNLSLLLEKIEGGVKSSAHTIELPDDRLIVTFIYKVANLVGRLGDNTAGIRRAIREDNVLWSISSHIDQINILAHTRWASNGIISLSNCHPTDGRLYETEHQETLSDKLALFVLNGDVDNYSDLVESYVSANGLRIDPTITTDAKILPVFYRLGTNPEERPEDRFADLMNSCLGSLAVVMQHPFYPNHLFLAQKGSGQSLFVGKIKEGYILASEVYGLAALTRRCFSLVGAEKGGSEVVICSENCPENLSARFLSDGELLSITSEPIYIHSRDIYRGAYDYYFEKEIHEAPSSIRKTIKNKYNKIDNSIQFVTSGAGSLGPLLNRLRDHTQEPVRRITVIGQGTASTAAEGVAYLIQKAIEGTKIIVNSCKASELSGFLPEQSLSDMLLIAISQSGTTTDTNRTVDVASSQGAWIHSIVNRRNSPLVAKSNSYFYTSDGRDVEMAVASTKAFYCQIAAGKLTALVLAQELQTLKNHEISHEIELLESLPDKLEAVLNGAPVIKDISEKTGPNSRNWAVVGNGPNKIAANEIRIKLSELCYKSIPCDFTEDKKHIDLSTEPLTIVVANDLPDQIVQDTAKEVAIFKAHSGRPIVLCAKGETRFTGYAESMIEVPHVGAGLDFVPATAAGHLWGFYTARAIDSRADSLRNCRSLLTKFLDEPQSCDKELLIDHIQIILKMISDGEMNAALPASAVALISTYMLDLVRVNYGPQFSIGIFERGISVLTKAIEEMTRPIDSIRHQAKTVTVGISRPLESLPPIFLNALEKLQASPSAVRDIDRPALRALASVIDQIPGGMIYELMDKGSKITSLSETDQPLMQVTKKFGICAGKPSKYDQPRRSGGSKRTALRIGRMVLSSGRDGLENLLVIPLLEQKAGGCAAIVLFHLTFVEKASLQQKIALLKSLGVRYDELIERFEEIASPQPLETFLDQISPRDLILAPLDSVILAKSR